MAIVIAIAYREAFSILKFLKQKYRCHRRLRLKIKTLELIYLRRLSSIEDERMFLDQCPNLETFVFQAYPRELL